MVTAEDLPQDLVFVDLETTGGNAAYDRITEVGLVRVTNGELVEEWSSLVNPECPIPEYIEAFTGISNAMVAGAPRFAEIAHEVRLKLRGAVFVAHNARFDYSFLRSELLQAQLEFSAQVLCTVKLSRRLFPEYARHNLDAVMERNGLTCGARHRALGDAKVLHDFWVKLRREVDEPRLAAAVQTVLGAHSCPRTCRRAWPTIYRKVRACIDSSAQTAHCYTSARAIHCAPAFAATLPPALPKPRTADGRVRYGASIGWRLPANSAQCCVKPNGSRCSNPLTTAAPRARRSRARCA